MVSVGAFIEWTLWNPQVFRWRPPRLGVRHLCLTMIFGASEPLFSNYFYIYFDVSSSCFRRAPCDLHCLRVFYSDFFIFKDRFSPSLSFTAIT